MSDYSPAELALRQQIITTCRELERRGLNQGTSGNVSVRLSADPADGFLLTPTALSYDVMEPADIVHLSLDGKPTGRRAPSSEWRFHLDIMRRRPDATAIIHTHSRHATTLACLRKEIPAFHYLIALFGGNNIRCSGYALYGTQDLSELVLKALEGRQAALMGSHGLIVLGPSLEKALSLTQEAETLAAMYLLALQVGEPAILSTSDIESVKLRLATYGGYGTEKSK
jgi:L-fuculose-phosphate aldolase